MKRVIFVAPMMAPYSIERFHVLAREKEIDLHIIAETGESIAR